VEEWSEIVELDVDRWIVLEFSRPWPKYVADWSLRHRVGDGDFPLATGRVDHMPPRDGETLEDIFDILRSEATEEARAASASAPPAPGRRRGVLSRLLGRR
jgi:hypothetical protein